MGYGDTAPSGRARLDRIADWLQSIAFNDVVDAGIQEQALWVLRRTTLAISSFPRFGERLAIRTAISGYGALWAERRTSMVGSGGGAIETSATWVAIDPQTLHPMSVSGFLHIYGEAAGDRRVRARLRHPAPVDDATEREWLVRHADFDVAGHVNNAAYWQVIEEELAGLSLTSLDAEIEHLTPITTVGTTRLLSAGERRWLLGPDGEVHASFLIGPTA